MTVEQLIAGTNSLPIAMLSAAVVYLWRELKECQKNHRICDTKNILLAKSIEDLAEGKIEEALKKAQSVVDGAI